MPKITADKIIKSISAGLIEFGYPDASPELIREIYDAYKLGKRFPDLPHGVLGGFAERQLDELQEALGGPLP